MSEKYSKNIGGHSTNTLFIILPLPLTFHCRHHCTFQALLTAQGHYGNTPAISPVLPREFSALGSNNSWICTGAADLNKLFSFICHFLLLSFFTSPVWTSWNDRGWFSIQLCHFALNVSNNIMETYTSIQWLGDSKHFSIMKY